MARDYKHSKRGSGGSGNLSGIAGFVVGLALGLAVAVGVYLFDRRPTARLAQEAPPMTRDEAPDAAKPAAPAASQDAETQFEFYEMLPKFEVVIPEQDGGTPAAGPGTGPVEKPGAYILQAGSFRNHADADRVRALELLLEARAKASGVSSDQRISELLVEVDVGKLEKRYRELLDRSA